jgi:hypothetical protein
LALAAIILALWLLVIRERSEDKGAEGDMEFDTERDRDDEIDFEGDEPASGYQSQEFDQMIAEQFEFSDMFSGHHEETTMFSDLFQMNL